MNQYWHIVALEVATTVHRVLTTAHCESTVVRYDVGNFSRSSSCKKTNSCPHVLLWPKVLSQNFEPYCGIYCLYTLSSTLLPGGPPPCSRQSRHWGWTCPNICHQHSSQAQGDFLEIIPDQTIHKHPEVIKRVQLKLKCRDEILWNQRCSQTDLAEDYCTGRAALRTKRSCTVWSMLCWRTTMRRKRVSLGSTKMPTARRRLRQQSLISDWWCDVFSPGGFMHSPCTRKAWTVTCP